MSTVSRIHESHRAASPQSLKDWRKRPWCGTYAATLCPFHEDESIDDEGLHQYIGELTRVSGIQGVVCNGHTGEIMSLRPHERANVTQIVAQAAALSSPNVKIVSGVSAEGSLEAIDHAIAAREAGADAILLMPPHHWLRFGRSEQTAIGFVQDVADGADVDVILHQYPSWTKAGYSLKEMREMVRHPRLVMVKMGTRDMSRWLYDYESLKEAKPSLSIVTCHDEFLLPTLLEGADGALVGFAGFAPSLIVRMVSAALDGDLARAKEAQQHVAPLARMIYNFGEPGCGAHQRMKVARWLMGHFPSPHFRRPVRPLPPEEVERIRATLEQIGYGGL
jgi:4-hydroxy-tetrahydrodipicolinate synthase